MFVYVILSILAIFSLLWAVEIFRLAKEKHGALAATLFVGVNLMVIWVFPVLALMAPR